MKQLKVVHSDLLLLDQLVYKPMGFVIRDLEPEKESTEYGAAEFAIDSWQVRFRAAKITPTKTGQFVTFWKRNGNGPILPYAYDDPFDLLIVSVRAENKFGQFIFPKKVLCERGLISSPETAGKRAMRVYPTWDKADNPQARKTQAWQLEWYVDIGESPDFERVKNLFLGG